MSYPPVNKHSYGKSPFFMGNSTINGNFMQFPHDQSSVAMIPEGRATNRTTMPSFLSTFKPSFYHFFLLVKSYIKCSKSINAIDIPMLHSYPKKGVLVLPVSPGFTNNLIITTASAEVSKEPKKAQSPRPYLIDGDVDMDIRP